MSRLWVYHDSVLAALYCPPVLKELCLMSSMVIAKTTRILHAGSVKNFMSSRPDITVLHAVSIVYWAASSNCPKY